jgi:hypothetical protein
MKNQRVFEALDVINDGGEKAPITMFIQQGDKIINSKGCMRIEQKDCLLQADWSRQRQKFHPKTEEALKLFYTDSPYSLNPNHVLSKYNTQPKTEMELKVLGLIELVLWSMDVAKKKNTELNFYFYQPEQGLHPCYQTRLAELMIWFYKYSNTLK